MAVRKALVRVAGKLRQLPAGDTIEGLVRDDDARLTDAREWTASTVTQAEAEAGTATTRRAWTAQRVFQAIAAWWAASAMKTKLDGIAAGATANATDAQLRDRSTHTGTQAISTVTDLQTALDGKLATSARGVANGVASLDTNGLVPPMQLPSYVDDVLEYAATSNFPATGETGKIYIAINGASAADPTRQYRWTGSVYAEINPSPGTTDALAEGSTNLYFNESRVRNTVLTGLSLASSAAVAATDNVLAAFGKIQARLNLLGTAANANVQTSAVDSTSGRALVMQNSGVGPFGLGDVGSLVNDMNSLSYSGMGRVTALNTLNTPTAGVGYGIGMPHASGMSSLGGQLFLNYTTDSGSYVPWPRLFARSKASASAFGNWVEFWHTGNFNPATKQDKADVVEVAAGRTLALTDASKFLWGTTGTAFTLTIPTNAAVAFPVGTEIHIRGLGSITVAGASGVTVTPPNGGTLSLAANMTVTIKKVRTDWWLVIGQTVAA